MRGEFDPHRNFSAWALSHQTLILFLIFATVVGGFLCYFALGRAEDPSYTWKAMTIRTEWQGATAREVEQLVTDPLEKKLEELPYYDYDRSYSKPGESVIILNLKDYTPPGEVQELWYQVRKKISDIRNTLPSGINGPFFNDEFGDVYSFIYALTGHDFTPAQLKKIAEEARESILKIPNVEKVDLVGVQNEKIYVDISTRRLASYGISGEQVIQTIRRDNTILPSGSVDTESARVFVRVDAGFNSVEAIRAIPIFVKGKQFTIGDVADIKRGYTDPKLETIRYMGRNAIGIAIVMARGGNVFALSEGLSDEVSRIKATLPAGVDMAQVANQAEIVERSTHEFFESLAEALLIVMAVTFVALGWRAGIVVALAVPLVLALTLIAMLTLGIDLHRISLGALIIALGLLVDDAVIIVEMTVVKINQGWNRLMASSFAYTSTALPMLSGTLVTTAGFIPVGFARSSSGEYTNAIFWVVMVALLISWAVAVLFTPYLGYHLLPRANPHAGQIDLYSTRTYRRLRRLIEGCVRAKWTTIGVTATAFILAILGFGLVPRQFFPSSSRFELLVDIRLAEGSSFDATAAEVMKMEEIVSRDPNVSDWVVYTGVGSPRFFLTLDQQLRNANFSQFVVRTKGVKEREALAEEITAHAESDFPAARVRVSHLELGPPVGYPVQFRVIGGDPTQLRHIAYQVRDIMRSNPKLANVNLDWDELAQRVRIEIDPAKARVLGFTKEDLACVLEVLLTGGIITQYREGTELIDVVLRTPPEERLDPSHWQDLNIPLPTANGGWVPLGQLATIHYELEEPVLWRRSRQTAITVRADVIGGVQPPMVSQEIEQQLGHIRSNLPDNYRIEVGGAAEASAKGNSSIVKTLPLMLLTILGLLIVQLRSFARVTLALMTAPLGLIGVTGILLLTGLPFGFVATLGTIALAGIIMRNSIILLDQIEQDIVAGMTHWEAIIDATVRRARPITLTAAAAMLAMVPLVPTAFWGPMAAAIMGGLASATLLTLFFLPALYAVFYRVSPQEALAEGTLRTLRPPVPAE